MAEGSLDRLACECLAAGLGGAIADGMFNPLAVLQVRAQLQPAVPLVDIARDAVAQGGFLRGLWRPGLAAVCLRALTYSGFRVGCYPVVRKNLPGDGFCTKLCAGCMTGGIGAGLFAPFELVRVRMISAKPYSSTLKAFLGIGCDEGVFSLWRGAHTFLVSRAVYSATQLATYETAKQFLLRKQVFKEEGVATHFAASFMSGLCGAFVCHPIDTVKTVYMDTRQSSRSVLVTFSELVANGGISRLYKGLLPSLAMRGPMIVVFMPLVEQLRYHVFGLEFI